MRLVEAVAAGAAGLGVDRRAGLLQGADVPFDGAHADLESVREPARAAWPRRDGAKFFDDAVETIGPVHADHCKEEV
ncbi:hypothetical protein GCM10017567_31330 [Amycolatopsis bullii]|uniref:Uncharacterized protein n=1 Tax=Amycolatopsis bullii TaxID=941987 RepID=A0ABQ3KB95_9PSEU|nr:hypothetical protein GCM10017567_31330 [Amycolatopsis bullii]